MSYEDLNAIHVPADDDVIPDGWGQQIRTNQQFFHSPPGVQAISGSAWSLANNVWAAVPFDGADIFDTHNFHDPVGSNNRVIIPVGLEGRYLVTASVLFGGNSTGRRGLGVALNDIASVQANVFPTDTGLVAHQIHHEVGVAAGDEISIQAFQDSGGSLAMGHATYTNLTRLTVRWVSAPQG